MVVLSSVLNLNNILYWGFHERRKYTLNESQFDSETFYHILSQTLIWKFIFMSTDKSFLFLFFFNLHCVFNYVKKWENINAQ